MMKGLGGYLLSFSLGMNLVILASAWLIAPEGLSLWEMRVLPDLIEKCEKELPRTETCELVAQPKQ